MYVCCLETTALVEAVELAHALAVLVLVALEAVSDLALVVAAGSTTKGDTSEGRAADSVSGRLSGNAVADSLDTASVALKLVVPVAVDTAAAGLCRRQQVLLLYAGSRNSPSSAEVSRHS